MSRDVAVIDYGMGNLRSVVKAWEHVGARSRLVDSPSQIDADDLLVFPGQGAVADAMKLIKARGFDSAIREWIAADKPFFGVCLGLQLLFEHTEEGGGVGALGVFKGNVRRFKIPREYKVPHMGWNDVRFGDNAKILDGIDKNADQFYFVHSYFVDTPEKDIVFGTTEYGGREFTSAVMRGKLLSTQFHPEKSQAKGLKLYSNFLNYVS